MNRIADCLNAAGLKKPTNRDIRETVDNLLDQGMSSRCVEVLIGEILRMYQKWPKKVTETDDFEWLSQARPGRNGRGFESLVGGGRWMYATDGHRVHRIPAVTDISPTDRGLACAWFFKDLIQGHAVTLDSFQNVEETIVEFDGHTYLESYILQAFSGSPVMTAAPTSNGLYLAASGREAIVQEMRI